MPLLSPEVVELFVGPRKSKRRQSVGSAKNPQATRVVRDHAGRPSDSDVGYASERWIRMIATLIKAAKDIKTLEVWAREAGLSPRSLRACCHTIGLSAKSSLDFARVLRVVLRNRDDVLRPFEVLDIVDERTMKRLLDLAGIDPLKGSRWPSLSEYFTRQTFIRDVRILRLVAAFCESPPPTA
jgi:hypothetical protein